MSSPRWFPGDWSVNLLPKGTPMSRSLRTILATAAAAGLLVGGVSLASYATTRHDSAGSAGAGAGTASLPKTRVYTVGSTHDLINGGASRLRSVSVPKGNYEISVSGVVTDGSSDPDSLACLLTDKKTLTYILHHPGSLRGSQRLYMLLNSNAADSSFGFIDQTNPAAHVDRSSIVYGCTFNGTGPFKVVRPIQFTLTPVKTANQKKGQVYHLPAAKVGRMTHALR